MSVNAKHLELLRCVIEAGSLTAAAARLGISQPAVTKAVQLVEDQLGFPLFLRQRGRLVPTVEARMLLPEIIRATSALDAVNRLAEDLQGLRAGIVTLATTPVLANSIAAEAVAHFQSQHAGVTVDLQVVLNHEAVVAVADHRVDFGLVLAPAEHAHVSVEDICAAELICVMAPGHPLARSSAISVAELARHKLISFDRQQPLGALVDEAFKDAGLRRVVAVQVSQSTTACALAKAGAGVAVIDGFTMAEARAAGLVVRKLAPAVPAIARLLLPRHRPLSRPASRLTDAIRAVAGEAFRKCRKQGRTLAELATERVSGM
jgi:DNA-binding transcriptional LysR family regulator